MTEATELTPKGAAMATRGRKNLGIATMPKLDVTVHEEVARGFKAYALSEGISVRTLVRELLYDFARSELDIEVEDVPETKMTHK